MLLKNFKFIYIKGDQLFTNWFSTVIQLNEWDLNPSIKLDQLLFFTLK
jgi:hypothetical protein